MKVNVKKITAIGSGVAICALGTLVSLPQVGGESYTPGSLDDNVFMTASSAPSLSIHEASTSPGLSAFDDADEPTQEGFAVESDDEDEAVFDEDAGDEWFDEDEISLDELDYSLGDPGEYEGWYRLSAPKCFSFQDSDQYFSNDATSETFSFFVNKLEYSEYASYGEMLEDEAKLLEDIGKEAYFPMVVERKQYVLGDRTWDAVIGRSPDDETGEMPVSSVSVFTDLGNGEYGALSICQEPDQQWIQDMLATFSVLPGDPIDNYERFLSTLPDYNDDADNGDYYDDEDDEAVYDEMDEG